MLSTMRWFVMVGVAVAAFGCARANPEFAASDASSSSQGTNDTNVGSVDVTSEGTLTGITTDAGPHGEDGVSSTGEDPPFECGVDPFKISVDPDRDACAEGLDDDDDDDDDEGADDRVRLRQRCVQLTADGDGAINARPAAGCAAAPQPRCNVPSNAMPWRVKAGADGETLDLSGVLSDPQASVCARMWAFGDAYPGATPDTDPLECGWNVIAFWGLDGQLLFALGNTLPPTDQRILEIPGLEELRFTFSSELVGGTDCATDGFDESECPKDPGWRALQFATMPEGPALPNGEPTPAEFAGGELSVFNFGMQIDTTCKRNGRWAIVPAGREGLFE